MSISLTSAPGTHNQNVCINSSISNITYITTGASGANVIGLPGGVSYNYSGDTITISGMPTDTGMFTYTVTLTGGCGTITATGTITVKPNNTITLSSSSGTDNQTVCINNAITDINYSSTGATGATFSGLPTGVTGSFSGGNITISGTPTASGTFNYTVTLTGGCGTSTATGTIVVNICTAIKEVSSTSAWLIFPNPTAGTFTLQTPKGGEFELMDIQGRVLQVFKMQNSTQQIQVSLPNGMYFIREKASGTTQKLIVE
jgi:hypothetical protein